MSDIATLGIAVDSSQAVTAANNLDKLGAAATRTETQVRAIQAMADRVGVSFDTMAKRVDDASTKFGTASTLSGQFAKQADAVTQATKNTATSLSAATGAANDNNSALDRLANTLTRRVALAFAAKEIRDFTAYLWGLSAAIAASAQAAELASVSYQKFQGLSTAAAYKGVTGEALNAAMIEFGKQTDLAQNHLGSLRTLLVANGQTVSDTATNFGKVADLVANAATGAQKLSILQQAGLPATREFADLMSQGSQGISKAADAASKLTNDQIEDAKRVNDAWNKMWTNFENRAKRASVNAIQSMSAIWNRGFGGNPTQNTAANLLRSGAGTSLNSNSNVNQFYAGIGALGSPSASTVDPAILKQQMALEQQRIGILGQTATVEQQVRSVELNIAQARLNGVNVTQAEANSLKQLAQEQGNGVAAVKASIDAEQVKAATLGMSVGDAAAYVAIQTKLNEAIRNHAPLSAASEAALRSEADALRLVAQSAAQDAAQKNADFEKQTALLSDTEKQIATIQKQLHGDDWKNWTGDALSNTIRVSAALKTLGDDAAKFGSDLVSGLAQGKSLMDSLASAANALGKTLIDSGLKSLVNSGLSTLSGSAAGAALTTGAASAGAVLQTSATAAAATLAGGGVAAGASITTGTADAAVTLDLSATGAATSLTAGGVAAGAALWGPIAALAAVLVGVGLSLFKGSNNELKTAQDSWKKMADQVDAFNRAAAGFSLGPLTQELDSLFTQLKTLSLAALQAHDIAGLSQLQATFDAGVSRVVNEFINAGPPLGDLAQKQKAVTDEAKGLKDELQALGLMSVEVGAAIDASLIGQLQALKSAAEDSLKSDINSNQGFSWLNDINAAIAKFNALSGQVDPNLLSTWFSTTLQKIVDDAKLQGTAFQNLVNGIPQIAGYIHEYSAALDESGQAALAAAAAQEKANLTMRLLVATTDQSTLAGALAVNALKQQQEMQDAIAAGSQNIALLQQVQAAETYQIVKSFADKATAAAQAAADAQAQALKDAQATFQGFVKNITDYINHFLAGPDSSLSPAQQLANAQGAYNTQVALAATGNRDALNSITQYFDDLQKASKAYYGSSAAGQSITNTALGQLQALPSQISPEQFIVNAINSTSTAQINTLLDMKTVLSSAFDTGSLSTFAGALTYYLPKIDTNSDNSISFAEMKTAFGTNYSDGTLKAVFDKLDLNLDGKISSVELNTAGTKTNTIPIGDIKTNTGDLSAVKIAVQTLSDPTQLLALAQTSSNTAASGNLLAQLVSNISNGGAYSLGEVAAAMRLMMQQQNAHWGQASLGAIATFAGGTNFAPGGVALVGELGPELVNLPRGSQVIPNHVAFGNDNNVLVSELRRSNDALLARIDRLESRLVAAEVAGAEHIGYKLDTVAEHSATTAKATRRHA